MILEAPDLQAFKPRTPEGARQHWQDFNAKNGRTVTDDDRLIRAHVSENRWVADCPSCGAGIACWTEYDQACCLGCGHAFTVEWPADRVAGEAVLEARPPANRHWKPWTEPIAKLERENELMREIEARPVIAVVEPVRAVFMVECSGSGSLDDDVFRVAGTSYAIRYDDKQGLAEVELMGRSDADAARISKSLLGK